ncbi:hypothetical protein AAVH_23521 [Aphelenchoides avenae]|nr:hypothetical protein AAVH_23521 [Aphelenchus avenae]
MKLLYLIVLSTQLILCLVSAQFASSSGFRSALQGFQPIAGGLRLSLNNLGGARGGMGGGWSGPRAWQSGRPSGYVWNARRRTAGGGVSQGMWRTWRDDNDFDKF